MRGTMHLSSTTMAIAASVGHPFPATHKARHPQANNAAIDITGQAVQARAASLPIK